MARSGVLLLLGLTGVACFAAGWLMGLTTSSSSPPEGARPVVVEPAAPPEVKPDAPSPEPVPAEQSARTEENPEPTATRGSTGEAPGTGTIDGVVVDLDGAPVAGVTIRIEASWPGLDDDLPKGRAAPPIQPVEEEIRAYAEEARFAARTRRETTTGSDGKYAFPSLPESEYWINGWKKGFEVDTEEWGEIRPGTSRDFVAKEVAWVDVRVTLPDGSVPPDADLVFRGSGWESESWTPEKPRVALYPGNWTLKATHGPNGLYEGGPVALSVSAGGEDTQVALRLGAGQGISGTVTVTRTGEVAPVVYVLARLLEPDEEADATRLLLCDHAAWIGEDGAYAFSDIDAGRYHVGVVGARGEVLDSATVDVDQGLRTRHFSVSASGERDRFRLRVIGPDGEPLMAGDVRVRMFCAGGDLKVWRRDAVAIRDPLEIVHLLPAYCDVSGTPDHMSGNWSGLGESPDVLPSTLRHTVSVWAWERGAGEKEYDPFADRVVEVHLELLATVTVAVEGLSATTRSEDFIVQLDAADSRPDVDEWFSGSERAQIATGAVRKLGTHRPGKRKLALYALTGESSGRLVASKGVEIVGGDNPLSIAVPQLVDVTVRADSEAVMGHVITQVTFDGGSTWHSLDATSRAGAAEVFASLVPGTYRLVAWQGDQRGVMEFRLPGKSEVHFRPQPFDALVVDLDDPDAYLAQVGLRDRDLVVSIDGEELRGPYQIKLLLAQAQANGTARFGVLRNGASLEVEVDARRMYEGASLDRTRRR